MAYETKLIFRLLAEAIGRTETVEESYNVVMQAASVEGVFTPTYEDFRKQLKGKKESK